MRSAYPDCVCGRYVLETPPEELARFFSATIDFAPREFRPSWNIPPTTEVVAVTAEPSGSRHLRHFRWGLVPPWAKDLSFGARAINARAETVATRPAFRAAFRTRRCIVPADGYYEWRKVPGGRKQPHFVARADGEPIAFAGLFERFTIPHSEPARVVETCTIVTTAANADVAAIHDRMPVTLEPGDAFGRWLDPGFSDRAALERMCRPSPPHTFVTRRVGFSVNSVRNDGPDLVDEATD